MLNNIITIIKKFFSDVWSDIKKIPFKNVFSDTRILVITILSIIAAGIIFVNLDILSIVKGLFCVIIFYFIFLWRK